MQLEPFHHVPKGSRWESAFYDAGSDADDYLILPIFCMEVCGKVVIPVRGDDNSKEPTNNRHVVFHPPPSRLSLASRSSG